MSAWRPARLALSVALLAAALDALVQMGDGPLAPPPLSISGAVSWSNRTTAVVAAFALVRLIALALGGYLLVLAMVGGAVHTMRTRRGILLLDRATLPALRGALAVMGLGTLGIVTAPVTFATPNPPVSSTAQIRPVAPSTATIRPAPDAPPPPSAPVPPPAASSTDDQQHVVARGESLWVIAATRLAEARASDVSDEEIAGYWRAVVAANPLPNPDLLFVGQVIELPAVPSP
jgi:nucleoid-associated protein YgaU